MTFRVGRKMGMARTDEGRAPYPDMDKNDSANKLVTVYSTLYVGAYSLSTIS